VQKMVQPINLRLGDNNARQYFAQMRQQQQSNNSKLQAKTEEQIVFEIEKEIEQSLIKIKLKSDSDEKKNKIGMSDINENLNKVANMSSVIFQFEFYENQEVKIAERKKELILKVIDKETKEVLSQYPTEISVKIAKMLDQLLGRGQLTDATA